MKRAKDNLAPRDLPPSFNAAVKKVLAYRPPKNNKGVRAMSANHPAPPNDEMAGSGP